MPSRLHNVSRWIAERAAGTPERLAVVDDHRRLTYRALEERVGRAAAWLAAQGVARGDRVALLLGNRSANLELVFGLARPRR